MVAYLAFTNEKWVVALRTLGGSNSINFWSPSPKKLLTEIEDVMLYFYAEDSGGPRRYIHGRGKVKSFQVGTVKEAWERYGNKNGAANLRIFLKLLKEGQSATEPVRETSPIGWHILDEVTWRSKPLDITDLGIRVKLGTWRGRRLEPWEEQRIIRDRDWGFPPPIL
jgi:hypothetical protein